MADTGLPQIRRVVTGHDIEGKAVIVEDKVMDNVIVMPSGHAGALMWAADANSAHVNGPVAGNTAGKYDRIRRHPTAKKCICDIFGKPQTQPIANLLQAVSFLLCMHQVGLGEDRTA